MKRIFAALIVVFIFVNQGSAQEGKKVVDIVNEIKSEMLEKQSGKKTSSEQKSHKTSNDAIPPHDNQAPNHRESINTRNQTRLSDSHEFIIRLLEGNARFISGHLASKDFSQERSALLKGQHPFAIVLSCSDSRVPPELLFDESLGQLFVVRVAGNVVDSLTLGSIEYAAEHLHTPLMIILGHESCGAVSATIQGGEVSANIASLVKRIKPSVAKVKNRKSASLKEAQLVSACVEENIREQIKQTQMQSEVLHEMIENGEFAIVGAVYSLESGTVRFLSTKNSTVLLETEHRNSEKQIN